MGIVCGYHEYYTSRATEYSIKRWRPLYLAPPALYPHLVSRRRANRETALRRFNGNRLIVISLHDAHRSVRLNTRLMKKTQQFRIALVQAANGIVRQFLCLRKQLQSVLPPLFRSFRQDRIAMRASPLLA